MPFRGKIGNIKEILRNGEELLSLEWLIKDFFNLSIEGTDFYESDEFTFGGEKWFLRLWPSGMTWAFFDWLDLHLVRKVNNTRDEGPPPNLDVSAGIRGVQGLKERRHLFSAEDASCEWSNFCLRSTLQDHKSDLMPDGVLTITCHVKRRLVDGGASSAVDVSACQEAAIQLEALAARSQSSEEHDAAPDQEPPIQTETVSESRQENNSPPLNRHASVIRFMRALLKGGNRSDFTLKLGAREWALHKFILESRSPYFAEMFLGDWRDSAVGEVPADDVIKEEALDSVLSFIYTGEVEDIYVEDLCDLYIAANRYRMKELKILCVDSMKENMCAEIVCRALAIAKTHQEAELNAVALDYFVRESQRIFESQEWDELTQEHPEMLSEILEETASMGVSIG